MLEPVQKQPSRLQAWLVTIGSRNITQKHCLRAPIRCFLGITFLRPIKVLQFVETIFFIDLFLLDVKLDHHYNFDSGVCR